MIISDTFINIEIKIQGLWSQKINNLKDIITATHIKLLHGILILELMTTFSNKFGTQKLRDWDEFRYRSIRYLTFRSFTPSGSQNSAVIIDVHESKRGLLQKFIFLIRVNQNSMPSTLTTIFSFYNVYYTASRTSADYFRNITLFVGNITPYPFHGNRNNITSPRENCYHKFKIHSKICRFYIFYQQ